VAFSGGEYDVRFDGLRFVVSEGLIFEPEHAKEVAVVLGGVQVLKDETGRFRTFLKSRCPAEFVIGETFFYDRNFYGKFRTAK